VAGTGSTKTGKTSKPRAPRRDHKSVRLALEAHGGNVTATAEHFGVARQTVYNWIDRYGLREHVDFQRDKMFELAERNINYELQKGSFEASKFVLTHFPTEGRWSSRSEFTGKDGAALIPDDVAAYLQERGKTLDEVLRDFVDGLREIRDSERL
jgi:hypothetical protein